MATGSPAAHRPARTSRLAVPAPLLKKKNGKTRCLWAVTSITGLANSMRTRAVDHALLRSADGIAVVDGITTLDFIPALRARGVGLIFFCGSGVTTEA